MLLSAFCVALLLGIASCKDDDDAPTSVQGDWQGTSAEVEFIVFSTVVQSQMDESFDALVSFHADGSLTIEDDGEEASGTWEQSADRLTITTGYEYEGVNLSGDFDIEKNSGSQLVLTTERDHTITPPGSETELEGTIRATLNFERLR